MQTLFGNPPQAPPPTEAAPAVYRIEIDRKLASTALAVVTLLNLPDAHDSIRGQFASGSHA